MACPTTRVVLCVFSVFMISRRTTRAAVTLSHRASHFLFLPSRIAVYGLGGESVFVGIDILATKWFKGAEMGLAYGIIQALGQVSDIEK